MTNLSNKVFAVGHLSVGAMIKKETLAFHLIMVGVKETKTTIQQKARATIIARNLELAKVSVHFHLGFLLNVWFSEKEF